MIADVFQVIPYAVDAFHKLVPNILRLVDNVIILSTQLNPPVPCVHRGEAGQTVAIPILTTKDGGFAEYCNVPASQAYLIGDSLSYLDAAMAEPVACCLHGIDLCGIKAGSTVLVIGGGMIGLIMLQLARLHGAAIVILSEPVAEKRALAVQLGADLTLDPNAGNAAKALRTHGISRVDTVIECVGSPGTMSQAIKLASPMATVMLFGLAKPSQEITIQPFDIFKREIVLKASYINPYTQKRAVALIQSARLDVTSMMCPPAPLEELPEILADPVRRSAGKYVILP